ncbi:hypothetical protein BC937DRAFT_90216 [Endogone sp. FLAS-F59071]|nr:hypothetical protein BC937DRAFT_90216 [Endogone sp. FLAS-F59071]|eukprot:RUS17244.1 hypothetical protein BC937DRAFT_90216 [Endogone sp. FLAS-F59071]
MRLALQHPRCIQRNLKKNGGHLFVIFECGFIQKHLLMETDTAGRFSPSASRSTTHQKTNPCNAEQCFTKIKITHIFLGTLALTSTNALESYHSELKSRISKTSIPDETIGVSARYGKKTKLLTDNTWRNFQQMFEESGFECVEIAESVQVKNEELEVHRLELMERGEWKCKRISTGEYVRIDGVANEGQDCSPNGLVGRDGNGLLLSRHGNWSEISHKSIMVVILFAARKAPRRKNRLRTVLCVTHWLG